MAAGKLGFAVFTLTTATTGYFIRSLTTIERGLVLGFSAAVIVPSATIWIPAMADLVTVMAFIAVAHSRKGKTS